MKWIGYCLPLFLLLTPVVSCADSTLENVGKNHKETKIHLIRCELDYVAFLLWEIENGFLDSRDGIHWIRGVLEVVINHLEEDDCLN